MERKTVFGEEYHTLFSPKNYLSQHWQLSNPVRRNPLKHMYEFYKLFSDSHPGGLKILDLGCGPVIAYAISAVEYASEIVMAEYTELNRQEVTKWINKDPDAHDWSPYLEHVIKEVEGKTDTEILPREAKLRKMIQVIPCDVTKDPIISPEYVKEYDVVQVFLVLEPACSTNEAYLSALKRIWSLVKPGGAFMLYSVLRHDKPDKGVFEIGGELMFNLRIDEEFIESALKAAGFRPDIILPLVPFNEKDADPIKYTLFISYKQ